MKNLQVAVVLFALAMLTSCGLESDGCVDFMTGGPYCIKENWEQRFPEVGACAESEHKLDTISLSTNKYIELLYDWEELTGHAWVEDGRLVFVSMYVNGGEFGLLTERNLIFELLKTERFKDAVTFGCEMQLDVTREELDAVYWSVPVFSCKDWTETLDASDPEYFQIVLVVDDANFNKQVVKYRDFKIEYEISMLKDSLKGTKAQYKLATCQ